MLLKASTIKGADRILITGANGQVGRHLARNLVKAGEEVRCIVRSAKGAEALKDLPCEVAIGNIHDAEFLTRAMGSVKTVVHLIGIVRESKGSTYEYANLKSTLNLLTASKRNEVHKFIFLSYPGANPEAKNPYLRTKGQAEKAIINSGLRYTIFRSAHIYGPNSIFLKALVELIRRKRTPIIGTGKQKYQPIYVEDVANCIYEAIRNEKTHNKTLGIAGPDVIEFERLLGMIAEMYEEDFHPMHVPMSLLRLFAKFSEWFSPHPQLTPPLLELLAGDCLVDSSEMKKISGISFTPLRLGLERSLETRKR